MKRRLVSFGCSHAFGAEMHGRGIINHDDNFELNYANFVAQHYNLDFKLAARCGYSNKQILHDVIELVEPNDICLLAWTYGDRDRYIKVDNTNPKSNTNFSGYHALKVLYDHDVSEDASNMFTKMFGWFTKEDDRANVDEKHYFLNTPNDKNKMQHLISFSQAYYKYYGKTAIKVIDFLETYQAVNAIIQSRGATALNFHYSMENEILKGLTFAETISAKYIQPKDSYSEYNKNNTDKLLFHTADKSNSQLFDYYNKDTNKIEWHTEYVIPISFVDWYMKTHYKDYEHNWPDNRMGHLGPHAHKVLSKYLIEHLEDNMQ